MQLDVGNEPYLSTAQAPCLFINHIFYIQSLAIWQRIRAMASQQKFDNKNDISVRIFFVRVQIIFFTYCPISQVFCDQVSYCQLQYFPRNDLFSSELFSSPDGQTDRQTDRQKATHMSPPCNMHRQAQKERKRSKYHYFKQPPGAGMCYCCYRASKDT